MMLRMGSTHNMPDSRRVLVAIATYNEIDNLPGLVEEIRRFVPASEIVVVDDNSPDGTGRWCDTRVKEDPRFHVIHRAGKLGLGSATVSGLQFAMERGFDLVVTLDADFSHHPRYIPAMLAVIDDSESPADVVIGSRYVAGGGVEGWPLRRRLMSRCLNLYARWMLGLRAHDCSGAFRCFRVAVLNRIPWDRVRSDGYSFLEELLWLLQRAGARLREIPIIFVDRTHGRSKISGREARAAVWIIFQLALERWKK
jgi:dolichol-phosphate mannosyltransferase